MALFCHYLHIRPWEMELLTTTEFESLLAWVEHENTKNQ